MSDSLDKLVVHMTSMAHPDLIIEPWHQDYQPGNEITSYRNEAEKLLVWMFNSLPAETVEEFFRICEVDRYHVTDIGVTAFNIWKRMNEDTNK